MFRRCWYRRRPRGTLWLIVGVAVTIIILYIKNGKDDSYGSGLLEQVAGRREKRAAEYRFERYEGRNNPRNGPGEWGKGVYLEGKEKELADKLFKKEAFNIVVSDKIALDRTIADVRDPQ